MKSVREKPTKLKKNKVCDCSQFLVDCFNYDISQVKWSNFISSATNDIKMFSFFYKEFNKIVNKHAPMKTLSHRKAKQCSKPWITKGIRTSKLKTSYIYLTMTLKINFIEIKSAV